MHETLGNVSSDGSVHARDGSVHASDGSVHAEKDLMLLVVLK